MEKNSVIKLGLFALGYLLLSGVLTYYYYLDRNHKIATYLEKQISYLFYEYRSVKTIYQKLSYFAFDEIFNDQRFIKALKRFSKTKNPKVLREALLPHYNLLQRYSIRYLRVLTPHQQVLVSFPKPLTSKPKNQLLLEFQKPIYFNNSILLFLQSAISYNVIKEKLNQIFDGEYQYIVNGELINKEIFSYDDYVFIQSDLSKQFFYEEKPIRANKEAYLDKISYLINIKIKDKVQTQLEKGKSFALIAKAQDRYYTVVFLALNRSKNVGYLISYKEDDIVGTFYVMFWRNVLLGNLLIFGLLGFFYYYLYTRYKFEVMRVTDKLTKLYNRFKFYKIAEQELARTLRYDHPLSLMLIDIDNFNQINKQYGYDVGDEVLKEFANLLRKEVRKFDYLFRWGGDEFLILTPETNANEAMKLAQNILDRLQKHTFDQVGKISASVGVTQLLKGEKTIDLMLKRADGALHKAKTEGGNKAILTI
ncbi:MAG: GGDEF domain-containing protein [Epsilonproteobacteria bacterium]|nr:GGDEF domain-containing protein [Campylobacterota bacterium]